MYCRKHGVVSPSNNNKYLTINNKNITSFTRSNNSQVERVQCVFNEQKLQHLNLNKN
jgi:hypothetical protein